jgi:undecaprenyl-diphosphatase
MDWIEALILGIIQGLTEFLPVSSSGHLELGKLILGVDIEESLSFTVVVHGATVLSTILVFRKDIFRLFKALFRFKWDDEMKFISKLLISIFPVALVGVFFKEEVESLFSGNILLVGSMLLVTASLLSISHFAKKKKRPIGFLDSIIIGIAQALAVIPGISRSGATIATGLILGNNKAEIARFSFLMVLIPIIGANLIDLKDADLSTESSNLTNLIVGFFAAFISGFIACKWMIKIITKGKLTWFALYCTIIGSAAILYYFVV